MRFAFIGDNNVEQIEADCQLAKEIGAQGLEYNYWGEFDRVESATVAAMRKVHEKHGLKVSMFGAWGLNPLHPDPAARRQAHERIEKSIRLAAELGADHLVMGGGEVSGEPVARSIAEFTAVMPRFIEQAQSAGLRPVFYAVHGGFMRDLPAMEQLWAVLPDLRLKFDPANWYHAGQDYLEVARRYGRKIGYVHIKDAYQINGRSVTEPPAGMGDIQWGRLFAWLHQSGYDGWLSIEPHGGVWGSADLRRKNLILSKRYVGQFVV